MKLFEPVNIGSLCLKNRVVRSAAFEGMADPGGVPGAKYEAHYAGLAEKGMGLIITGFAYVGLDGKAMQPGQAGIDNDRSIPLFSRVTGSVHKNDCAIFLQIAHAGRQTVRAACGGRPVAPSGKRSWYFRCRPSPLTSREIERIISGFAGAARRARDAGFDGVQLHCAHGYLVHQFISPSINNRKDAYGIDRELGIGGYFLECVINKIRDACGNAFPLAVKISGDSDWRPGLTKTQFVNLIKLLDIAGVDAIEVSCGTMEQALNIFRVPAIPWDTILAYNPRYRVNNKALRGFSKLLAGAVHVPSLKKFSPAYNLHLARVAKEHTTVPVISVGGFRTGTQLHDTVESGSADLTGLCRPFICEPDFLLKVKEDPSYKSRCVNCSRCAIMCDSGNATRCYRIRSSYGA